MKAVNTSDNLFTLESGICKPGSVADFTYTEFKMLSRQGLAEVYTEKKKSRKSKAVSNGD